MKFYQVDLINKSAMEQMFIENQIESVIYFAGLKSAGESVQRPLQDYHNNKIGTLSLLDLMKKYGVYSLVFSSSATVYGVPDTVPIIRDFPLSATNPYGCTKLMIEQILRDLYVSNQDWSIAMLRYFNPIGAHESGWIGEEPNDIPNNLMPYITQVAVGRPLELNVFGNDYSTIDGTGVRDYIHMVDLAKGHIKALDKVMHSTGIEAYNLGTGKGYGVLEMIATFEKVSGKAIPYKVVDRRSGGVDICYSAPTKAKKELDWLAEKGLVEMCADAWRWQVYNPNGYASVSNENYKSIF